MKYLCLIYLDERTMDAMGTVEVRPARPLAGEGRRP
jgi:hypothetical protein